MLIALISLSTASATSVTSCRNGGLDAPSGMGTNCRSACTMQAGGTEFNCDVDVDAGGNAGVGWVVSDYNGNGSRRYSAFGSTSGGQIFCCVADDTTDDDVTDVYLMGSPQGDVLSFTYDNASAGGTDADLEAALDAAKISGFGSADEIYGSKIFSVATTFEFYGNQGADTITGFDADEFLYGGDDGDDLFCGAGDDQATGDGEGDDVEGGDGNDVIFGGGGGDNLRGQADSDSLFGESGSDTLCAGSGTGVEYLTGANYSSNESPDVLDVLWIPSSNTAIHSGASQANDDCGHTTHGSTWAGGACDYSLTAQPSGC